MIAYSVKWLLAYTTILTVYYQLKYRYSASSRVLDSLAYNWGLTRKRKLRFWLESDRSLRRRLLACVNEIVPTWCRKFTRQLLDDL